jgi:hypothetical protein
VRSRPSRYRRSASRSPRPGLSTVAFHPLLDPPSRVILLEEMPLAVQTRCRGNLASNIIPNI